LITSLTRFFLLYNCFICLSLTYLFGCACDNATNWLLVWRHSMSNQGLWLCFIAFLKAICLFPNTSSANYVMHCCNKLTVVCTSDASSTSGLAQTLMLCCTFLLNSAALAVSYLKRGRCLIAFCWTGGGCHCCVIVSTNGLWSGCAFLWHEYFSSQLTSKRLTPSNWSAVVRK
jgi:hypothetical protein